MNRRMIGLCVILLCAPLCGAPPATSLVVVVSSPVSVNRGHETTLPCWLSPQQSAEDLEIRWYRDNFDKPVMLYKSKKVTSQGAAYTGRVSFGVKDAASGGLQAGDVSLKLLNVTSEDEGVYTCYVSSDQGYDSSSVSLSVTATGSQPFLTAVWTDDNKANVSCVSEGWYPRPALHWSDQKQDLTPRSLVYKNSSGLFSVHSWLLVPSSSELSCSVGLSSEEAKKVKVRLEIPPPPAKMESGSSLGGWVAFGLLLVATLVLAAFAVFYFKKKVKKSKSASDRTDEMDHLLPKEMVLPRLPSEASKCCENIKLEDTNNPYLVIKDTILRDAQTEFPDGQRVTCLTAVKGTSGFSSGKHYWEVSLRSPNLEIKHSWWVGVTSAAEIPRDLNFCANTSNGFWFLSSSPDRADSFQFSTEPEILIPVRSRPPTVGVYLDCDSGELSFYNVEDQSLIGSFKAAFKGEVFPFFNPGKGDKSPMKIVQKPKEEQRQADDGGNYVDSAVSD